MIAKWFLLLCVASCCRGAKISDDIAKIGFQLLSSLNASQQTLVLSPLGVHAALTRIYLASSWDARKKLEKAVFHTSDLKEIRAFYGKLHKVLIESKSIGFINQVYVDKSYEASDNEKYERELEQLHFSSSEFVDFSSNATEEVSKINKFVKESSNGTISGNLLAEDHDDHVVMSIANALYMNGDFAYSFFKNRKMPNSKAIVNKTFHGVHGDREELMMLGESGMNNYATTSLYSLSASYYGSAFPNPPVRDNNQKVEWGERDLWLYLIIPKKNVDLGDLIRCFANGTIDPPKFPGRIKSKLESVDLTIPFLSFESNIELSPILQSMDVNLDLTGMNTKNRALRAKSFRQIAKIDVREQLRHNIHTWLVGGIYGGEVLYQMVADRPFIFGMFLNSTPILLGTYV